MDKPASVFLEFDRRNPSVYLSIVKVIARNSLAEVGDLWVAVLPVKSYSLADHQFIEITANVIDGKGKEVQMQIWIPRNLVKAILEGKADLSAAFSFAGSGTK